MSNFVPINDSTLCFLKPVHSSSRWLGSGCKMCTSERHLPRDKKQHECNWRGNVYLGLTGCDSRGTGVLSIAVQIPCPDGIETDRERGCLSFSAANRTLGPERTCPESKLIVFSWPIYFLSLIFLRHQDGLIVRQLHMYLSISWAIYFLCCPQVDKHLLASSHDLYSCVQNVQRL